ncbi:hypothetical protein ACSFA8_26065 [Variovorax sp. RT4R15]
MVELMVTVIILVPSVFPIG